MLEFDIMNYVAVSIIFCIYQLIRFLLKKEFNLIHFIFKFVFVLYICLLISVVFFPILVDQQAILARKESIGEDIPFNLVPFKSIYDTFSFGLNHGYYKSLSAALIGNFLLLLPFGLYISAIWGKLRKVKKSIVVGMIISLTIESIQLLEDIFTAAGRSVDIDDIILNTLGFVVGCYVGKYMFQFMQNLSKKYHFVLKNKKEHI
ncbi:VanZ family protein [Saccharibacillus kuerlensis]|uniref:VanZ family protein n=1 Tax=Saccharibacillus kuerlensis TaxID=459527 RepID=A0ABQ2L2Q1_9BACL|nr:VanZ family protein [Saccharibacillus kuerlensis]GGO00492.1 VanZ family protein [Saccharibacillus kuerlensis]